MNYVEACNASLHKLIFLLGGKSSGSSGFSETLTAFEDYKNAGNSAEIKVKTGLDDGSFGDFLKALQKLKKYLNLAGADPQEMRPIQIAALRLLNWFDRISKAESLSELSPISLRVANELAKTRAQKQVRATELVIRSLMVEKYHDQRSLREFIHEHYARDSRTIDKIEKNAAAGDILSGTDFSQLVSLFLTPDEFQKNYAPLYEKTSFLIYLEDKRKTLLLFLDDIRRVRNDLAHNKPLTAAQIELLNLYYDEIMTPIQDAFSKSLVKVNPEQHLEVDDAELRKYLDNIKKELTEITEGVIRIAGDVGWIRRNQKRIVSAILALVILFSFTTYLIQKLRGTTAAIQSDTGAISSQMVEERRAIEQDPATIGLVTLRLDSTNTGTASRTVIPIWAAIYLNAKGGNSGDISVKAAIDSKTSTKTFIDISKLLAPLQGADAQSLQFEVPADAVHIFVCITSDHPTLHKLYTGIWSFSIGLSGKEYTISRDRPAQIQEGVSSLCSSRE
jgi:hypothetical protein